MALSICKKINQWQKMFCHDESISENKNGLKQSPGLEL